MVKEIGMHKDKRTKTMLEKMHMRKEPRKDRYIAADEWDLIFSGDEVKKAMEMSKQGESIYAIADKLERKWFEIHILLLDKLVKTNFTGRVMYQKNKRGGKKK